MTDREIREKLIVSGAGKLSTAELLALVIRDGGEAFSAVDLAEKILEDFSNPEPGRISIHTSASNQASASVRNSGHGLDVGPEAELSAEALSELASAGVGRIRRAASCGTTRAARIAAALELGRRVAAARTSSPDTISTKEDVVRLFSALAELGHEEFWVLYLTSGGRIMERARLSQGGVAGTVVDHKLVVKRAVELLASSLILVHNHPSGLARPSRDDDAVTEKVRAAAALFDINVIDHIIISRSGSYSFAENAIHS